MTTNRVELVVSYRMETLWRRFQSVSVGELWFESKRHIASGTQGAVYVVTIRGFDGFEFALKITRESVESIREAIVHSKITEDLVNQVAPPVFPWLLRWYRADGYVCLLMNYYHYPDVVTLFEVDIPRHEPEPNDHHHQLSFWLRVLRDIAIGVNYLETTLKLNHGDLLFKNILVNTRTMELIIIDFGSVIVMDTHATAGFEIGRDLNCLLYLIMYTLNLSQVDSSTKLFPDELVALLKPRIKWRQTHVHHDSSPSCVDSVVTMSTLEMNVELVSIGNPDTSGRSICDTIASFNANAGTTTTSPTLDYNKTDDLDLHLAFFIGDSIGMPLHLDFKPNSRVSRLEDPSGFYGLYSSCGLGVGGLSDHGRIGELLYQHFRTNGQFRPVVFKDTLTKWYSQTRIPTTGQGAQTSNIAVSGLIRDTAISDLIERNKRYALSPTCISRYVPIAIALIEGYVSSSMLSSTSSTGVASSLDSIARLGLMIERETTSVANFFEVSQDGVKFGCFVNKLLFEIWKRKQRGVIVTATTSDDITYESLVSVLKGSSDYDSIANELVDYRTVKSAMLKNNTSIVGCIKNVLWSIHNGSDYVDSVLKAIHVRGYTANVGALTSVIGMLVHGNKGGGIIPNDWITLFKASRVD